MTREQRFSEIVVNNIPCINNTYEELEAFYNLDYKIIELNGYGIMGYTEHEMGYLIWFVYTDNKLSNAKIVYNTAKELARKKDVFYSGVKNFYENNSIEIKKDLYQIIIGA